MTSMGGLFPHVCPTCGQAYVEPTRCGGTMTGYHNPHRVPGTSTTVLIQTTPTQDTTS